MQVNPNKQNKRKQNKRKENKRKPNQIKQNKTKQNKTKTKQNKQAVTARFAEKKLLLSHIEALKEYRKSFEAAEKKGQYKTNPSWEKPEL